MVIIFSCFGVVIKMGVYICWKVRVLSSGQRRLGQYARSSLLLDISSSSWWWSTFDPGGWRLGWKSGIFSDSAIFPLWRWKCLKVWRENNKKKMLNLKEWRPLSKFKKKTFWKEILGENKLKFKVNNQV